MSDFFNNKRNVALVAAGVVAVPVMYGVYKATRPNAAIEKKKNASAGPVDSDNVEEWTVSHVQVWLESIGVRETTRAKFEENDVDGAVLTRLQEGHLQEMGIASAGDRIKISSGLEKLLGQTATNAGGRKTQVAFTQGEDEDEDVLDPRVESEYKERLAKADVLQKEALVNEQKHIIELAQAIIGSLRNMFSVLGSEEFISATPAEQEQILNQAEQQLEKLIPAAKQLPEREREQVLPATESLASMIVKARDAISNNKQTQGKAPILAGAAPEAGEEGQKWVAIGNSIMESLRELRKLVHSAEAKSTPASERKEVLESVLSQVAKIQEFTDNFPIEAKEQLQHSCMQLAKEAVENLGSSAEAAALELAPKNSASPASAQHLTTRLRAIFAALRNPEVMQAPAQEQAAFFGASLRDVQALKAEAARLEKAEERDVVLEIASNIISALEQTKKLCEAKLVEENRIPILPLPELVGELRDLMTAVKSEEFLSLTPNKRAELLDEMEIKLQALQPSLAALGEEEREGLAPSFDKLKQFILMLRAQNKQVGDKTAAQTGQRSEEKDNQILASVIDALKEMYGLLSSEKFRAQPIPQRVEMSKGLLARLGDVKSTVATLGEEQQSAVRDLVGSLESMLTQLCELAVSQGPNAIPSEDADLSVDEQSQLTPQDRKAVEVVDRVQQLFAVINSDQFTSCTPEKRRDLASAILRQVEPLQRDVMTLGDEHKTQLTPVLESLHTTLTSFVGDSEEAEADVYSKASGCTQKMLDGKVTTMSSLKVMMDVLEELDAAPPTSEEQLAIRKEFQMTLSSTIDKLQAGGGPKDVVDDEEDQVDEQEGDIIEDVGDVQVKFRTALAAIQTSLEQSTFTAVEELTPYTTILEEILNAAEKDGIEWRGNKKSLNLVKKVIDSIQQAQTDLANDEDEGGENDAAASNSVVMTINQAHDTLKASRNKMNSVHELTPYLELLDTLSQMQDGLGLPELKAQQQLQQLVIDISEDLKNDAPPALDGDEDEESGETKEEHDEQDAKIVSMLRQLAAKIAVHDCTKASDLGPYTQMVESFRAKPYKTPAVIKGIEQVDSIIKAKLQEIGKTPEDCKAELVESKRDSLNKLHSVITHGLFIRLPQDQQLSAIGKASRLLESLTQDETVALQDESAKLMDALEQLHPENEELVPGAVAAELSLVPRILDRLKVEDFLEQTTAFEVRQIAAMFARLAENRELQSTGDAASVLNVSKDLFDTRISGFGETPCKDAASVQNPLQVRRMVSETEDGVQIIRYLLIGPEEEEYEYDETVMKQFASSPKKEASPISKEVAASFEDKSEALILVLPGEDKDTVDAQSHIAELSSLAENLSKVHNFNVNCVKGESLNATNFLETVEEIVQEKPNRFLLYIHSGANKNHLPHQMTFPDGSMLTYADLLKQCAGSINHSWLVHDSGRAFDCAVMKEGRASPYVGLGITDGGFAISNISRCWLYDGLFTPLFLELITAPGQLSLCPEDAVNHVIRQLTGTNKTSKGCYLEDDAITASFLLDALDAEADDEEEEEEEEEESVSSEHAEE